jgi:hypothetical protein
MAESGIEALETSLRLLQAQQLARRGRLREAIEVVAPGGVPPADNVLLQTLAALATGAGNYRMALPLWRQLLERDPENREARRMIYVIELWAARPPWMQWFWPLVGCAAGAVLLVVVLMLV